MSEIDETVEVPFEGEYVEVPADDAGCCDLMVVDDDYDEDDYPQYDAGSALAVVGIAAGGYLLGRGVEYACHRWLVPLGHKFGVWLANKCSSKEESNELSENAADQEAVKEELAATEQLANELANGFVEKHNQKVAVKAAKKRR